MMTIEEMKVELEARKVARDTEYARFIARTNEGFKDNGILLEVARHASAIVELIARIDIECNR